MGLFRRRRPQGVPTHTNAAVIERIARENDYEGPCNERFGRAIHHQPTGAPDPGAYARAYEARTGTGSVDNSIWVPRPDWRESSGGAGDFGGSGNSGGGSSCGGGGG